MIPGLVRSSPKKLVQSGEESLFFTENFLVLYDVVHHLKALVLYIKETVFFRVPDPISAALSSKIDKIEIESLSSDNLRKRIALLISIEGRRMWNLLMSFPAT